MSHLINNHSPPLEENQLTANLDLPEAEVSVGDIEIGDEEGKYVPPTNPGVFDDYQIVNRYAKRYGRYMAGISSPNGFNGQSVAFVQLWNPTLLLVSDWTVQSTGRQPEIPNPEPTDSNLVLLGAFPELRHLEVVGDSVSPTYRISGVYVYGFKNPQENIYKDTTYPRPPFMKDDFSRKVSDDVIQDNIIDGEGGGI